MAVTEGVAQAKDYAERLHIQYTYFINGDGIYQIDMETGAEKYVSHYPSSEELGHLPLLNKTNGVIVFLRYRLKIVEG